MLIHLRLDILQFLHYIEHAYVAFSRVRDCKNVRVFINDDQLEQSGIRHGEFMPIITNIVYQEIVNKHLVNLKSSISNIDYDGID